MGTKWNYLKSLRNGSIFGFLYSPYSIYQDIQESIPDGFEVSFSDILTAFITPWSLGLFIGHIIGGALLFMIIAGIRNLFVKS